MGQAPGLESRVLLRMATSKDAVITGGVLAKAGIEALACADMAGLMHAQAGGAGAILVAEEALAEADLQTLAATLGQQPAWSDLPVVALARHGSGTSAMARAIEQLPNISVIERPLRVAALVSTLRSTLRARQRQYQVRDLLENLRQTDQRKTEFIATLAHELRNPLAPIRASLTLLSSGRLDESAQARSYQVIRRQVDHMVRLVNDLMEVSRVTRGKVDLEWKPLPLGEALAEAVELSRPLIEAAGHRLSIELETQPLVVAGDRVRLVQVFANLLNNAAKYTPAAGRLALRAYREGASACVEVADNGIGLAPAMLPSIFEMFVQAPGASKAAQGGLGIGLTLARSLIERHGGSIEASSGGLDQGTTFRVCLPLVVAPGAAAARSATASSVSPSNTSGGARSELMPLTVLVVDDNRDAADSLRELLRLQCAEVLVAYSGEQALALAARQPVDVAVLDIGMPDMDGYELARRLRALPATQASALIALTGWGQDRDREQLATAGFDRHFLKPADPDALEAALREVAALQRP